MVCVVRGGEERRREERRGEERRGEERGRDQITLSYACAGDEVDPWGNAPKRPMCICNVWMDRMISQVS
jgi:hypothetical protein